MINEEFNKKIDNLINDKDSKVRMALAKQDRDWET